MKHMLQFVAKILTYFIVPQPDCMVMDFASNPPPSDAVLNVIFRAPSWCKIIVKSKDFLPLIVQRC